MIRNRFIVCAGVLFIAGCGSEELPEETVSGPCSGLTLSQIDHAVAPPANVASLIRVTHCDGKPLQTRLAPENFSMSEDGQVLSAYEALREVRPTRREISEITVIVLDLSGSVHRSGLKQKMIEGTHRLIDQLGENRRIAIYGFDGRPDLIPYANFTDDREVLNEGMVRIQNADLVDDSTNLYGAVVNALEILDTAVQTEIRNVTQVTHGTLVLFTDGTDRAQRVRGYSARTAVKHSPHSTFTIGVGAEIDAAILAELGNTGHMLVDDPDKISDAFEQVGRDVSARSLQDYVVSYCSPARAGAHELTIRVNTEEQVGQTTVKFYADNFGAGCDPSASLLR
jgi:uncharacterized protein YegL